MKGEVASPEAQLALWEAICDSAAGLGDGCRIYRSPTQDPRSRLSFGMSIAGVPTWKLVELLSMLAILGRADRVISSSICNALGKTGPIRFEEEGSERYLWAQPTLSGQSSLLAGRPDLLVTTVADSPDSMSILRVVECKCRTTLSGQRRSSESREHSIERDVFRSHAGVLSVYSRSAPLMPPLSL